MRTQVGIVGAGPAGLMLARLLRLQGIKSIIIENRSRDYIENRIRAGLIEHWAADLLTDLGVGERLQREGMLHWGINIGINGDLHRIDFKALVNKRVTIYGQQEVVKDLVEHRLTDSGALLFEVSDVSIHDLKGKQPKIGSATKAASRKSAAISSPGVTASTVSAGPPSLMACSAYSSATTRSAGSGSCRKVRHRIMSWSIPTPIAVLRFTPCVRRHWPDSICNATTTKTSRIGRTAAFGTNLHKRLGGARKLQEGKMLQKGITPMRSFVVEPMQYGRLFLAGDSAHIVPPTGAKGMNLAFADVMMLSRAVSAFYKNRRNDLLEAYSATCLRRVWKAQRFSWWMTQIMHRFPHETAFDRRRQLSDLDYLTGSKAAATSLAEQYVGLPLD